MGFDPLNFGTQKSYFESGVNENVCLTTFEYSATETAEALELEFKDDSNKAIKILIYNNINSARVFNNQTEEEAKQREEGNLNAKLRSIVLNFVSEEELIKKLTSLKPVTFKEVIECYKSLLPLGFDEVPGKLSLIYKNNGFLDIAAPYQTYSGKFFSVIQGENVNVTSRYEDKLIKPMSNNAPNDNPFIK